MLLAYCVKNESSCVYISFFHKANAFRTLRSAEAQRLLERFIFKKENARRRHSAVRPKVSEKKRAFPRNGKPRDGMCPARFSGAILPYSEGPQWRLEGFYFEKSETRGAQRRPARSKRKIRFFRETTGLWFKTRSVSN